MWKKLFILSLSIAVLFVFSAPISSVDAGSKNVNWQVAGSIANYIMVVDPSTTQVNPNYLISLSAKGPPGAAEITLMGYGSVVANTDCGPGEMQIQTAKGDMVARFRDLSLLFASIDETNPGYLCMDLAAGRSTFVANMLITGGAGRFEGATGTITGTGDGYYFDSGGALAAEVGEITGTIEF